MSENEPIIDVLSAISERRSIRAFLNKPIQREIIERLLETAKWAPSGVNTQPWQVAVLGKKMQESICQKIILAREANTPENPDYQYYPTEWVEPYKSRRKACGLALYSALNIDYNEHEKRKEQWYRNYAFFGAPVGLIFYIDQNLCKGSWVDMGMFIQNVMLAARGLGLETCAQASLAEYPDIIREALNLGTDAHVVCGMSLGFADWSHPINQYRTVREPLDKFTCWYE